MRIRYRLSVEYIVLFMTIALGIVAGSQHPITNLSQSQATSHYFSIAWLFSGNAAISLAMLFCSVFTGGITGLLALFINTFIYGSVMSFYGQSPWAAIFPWMEFLSLAIAVQIGADLFWALLFKWPINLKITLLMGASSLLLLLVAAFIEGGILNV